MKIKRKELMTYINGTPAASATYELLGGDLEEMNVDMNDNVESTTNILGESSVSITNGTRQATVDPYKADAGTKLHDFLQDIIDNQKELDDRKTDVVEVQKWKTPDGANYPAYKKDVKLEITSYGGNNEGYQIPFVTHFTGTQEWGAFNPATNTFTKGTWANDVFTPAV